LDFMLQAKYTAENTENHPIRWFGKGINSNARERAIVIHGAEYVSSSFIQNKRLGKSRLSIASYEFIKRNNTNH
jgi:hypothetical protein